MLPALLGWVLPCQTTPSLLHKWPKGRFGLHAIVLMSQRQIKHQIYTRIETLFFESIVIKIFLCCQNIESILLSYQKMIVSTQIQCRRSIEL